MHKFLSWTLMLALSVSLLGNGFGASAAKASATRTAVADEAFALLPPSNIVAVVDVGRVFNELLPRLKAVAPDSLMKITKDLDDFTRKTGVDPSKIKSAVIGLRTDGTSISGTGAIILPGLEVDPKRIEAAVKADKDEFKTLDYKGKPVFVVISKPKGNAKEPEKDKPQDQAKESAAKAAKLGDELAFAQLDRQGTVVGDVSSVKSVLDAQAGASRSEVNAKLSDVLNETKTTGLIRFAGVLPDGLKQTLDGQGDLFKQLSAVKAIFGSLDLASDLSIALDAKLRTASKDDATQLETSLKTLVSLGKSLLGGNDDPTLKVVNQLLDQIQIATQTTDVALSLVLPKSLFDKSSSSTFKKP